MRFSRGKALAMALSFQIAAAVAQVEVDLDDVDPLKDCKRRDVQLTESDGKVYMYGGQMWMKNGTEEPYQVTNHYLRIADFTTARSLNDSSILTIKDLPGNTTVFQHGAFWADSNRVRFVGGDVNDEGWLSRDGQFLESNWTNLKGNSIFTYNLQTEKWLVEPAVQPSDGPSVLDSFCCGSFAYNAPQQKAYYYSGTNGAGARKLDPFSVPVYVGKTNEETTDQARFLTFDASPSAFKWRNASLDTQLTTTGTTNGQFTFLPSTQSSTGGIAIQIGGRGGPSRDMAMETMRTVLVYDAETDTWYKQATTVQGNGDYPDGRANFCAVAASAPDGSSHNIYVYAGESDTSIPSAYSDMWILSVPAFHWIRADVESPPRKAQGCVAVGEKYMVTYGGVPSGYGEEGDKDDCDQENYGLRLFDMSELEWTTEFEGPPPSSSANGTSAYTVPKVVYAAIGGDGQGKATQTAPSAGFETKGLGDLFLKAKSTGTATTSAVSGEGTGTGAGTGSGGKSGSDSSPQDTKKKTNVGAIAGGVLGGLVVLAVILGGVLVLLKRTRKRREGRLAEAPGGMAGQQYVRELPADARGELPAGDHRGKWAAQEADGREYRMVHELPTKHN